MKDKKSNPKMIKIGLLMFVLLSFTAMISATNSHVEKWGFFSVELQGPSVGNPFTDVELSAVFKNKSSEVKVTGFYDGNGKYIVRFSPAELGKWTYETKSNATELNGKKGVLKCIKPSKINHGPIQVTDTFYLKYADGMPYFSVGTTCYAWTSQPKELQDQTINTLSTSPFNKIRMCVFPKHYIHNNNEPENFAFVHKTDSTFDFTTFDPEYWHNFEKRIVELKNLGIQADIILFHPYDKWGFAEMDSASDDRYIRYAMARLGAYENVWWSVANEFDFMTIPHKPNHRGNKKMEDWDRYLSIISKEDPYHRMVGIHNGRIWYDHTKPWVTHASVQSSKMEDGIALRDKYKKPVVFDECRYEGNIESGWGHLTAHEMTQRFWFGAVTGCYVGHGETYKDSINDILWWSKGGVLHGQSPIRIAFFKKIMEALPFSEMIPAQVDKNVFVLSKPANVYLVYAVKACPVKFTLAGSNDYKVEYIDTWNMKREVLKTVKGGEFTFDAPSDEYTLLLTAIK
ncbi:MAG: DUF5060 domain-containing protein [Paludibacter sp.]|nr:DUF5060 domain-containing protein [Paludibacter sp.]